jgi:hypothetical protein
MKWIVIDRRLAGRTLIFYAIGMACANPSGFSVIEEGYHRVRYTMLSRLH